MKYVLSESISGRFIAEGEKVYEEIHEVQSDNELKLKKLNFQSLSKTEFRNLLSDITGEEIDETVTVLTPFHTDFGKHISLGRHIFINKNVMLTDLGGIQIDDHVLIGPGASLLTVNHPIDPAKRRGLILEPIHLKENVWIGAGATVLPGVTIGTNSVVAANSTVTRDVPDNVVVAGTPAAIIKYIEHHTVDGEHE